LDDIKLRQTLEDDRILDAALESAL
jgi:hypothetical protein